jgi:N6-adenosine-specific RNA methylase IME4
VAVRESHRQNGSRASLLVALRTMTLPEICALPVEEVAAPTAHLYLWVPNALLPEGLQVMKAWGFQY